MQMAEFRALLSSEGLRLLDEVDALSTPGDVVGTVSRLRAAGHSPELVAAVLTQAKLRRRASAKFGDFAERMLFTEAGLEQATRLRVAALHAGRFQRAGITRVADLGCGIGADALALASLGIAVTAIERDEVTAAIAAYNLAPFPDARVVNTDAEDIGLDDADGIWLDPARRDGVRRLSDPSDWSPSLDFCFDLAAGRPTGIKLGPGIDRDLIPDGLEAQWVSVDRDVVELVLWSPPLARDGIRRAALLLTDRGAAEMTAASDSEDADTGSLGEWLYEPDGAVIRARLIGDLARDLGGRMLDPTIAWITTDERVDTEFAQRFRVVEEFPLDVKLLKREVAARGIGTLEIKKRGVDLDPAALRKRLAPKGDASATLILTRAGGRRVALLAERA